MLLEYDLLFIIMRLSIAITIAKNSRDLNNGNRSSDSNKQRTRNDSYSDNLWGLRLRATTVLLLIRTYAWTSKRVKQVILLVQKTSSSSVFLILLRISTTIRIVPAK